MWGSFFSSLLLCCEIGRCCSTHFGRKLRYWDREMYAPWFINKAFQFQWLSSYFYTFEYHLHSRIKLAQLSALCASNVNWAVNGKWKGIGVVDHRFNGLDGHHHWIPWRPWMIPVADVLPESSVGLPIGCRVGLVWLCLFILTNQQWHQNQRMWFKTTSQSFNTLACFRRLEDWDNENSNQAVSVFTG